VSKNIEIRGKRDADETMPRVFDHKKGEGVNKRLLLLVMVLVVIALRGQFGVGDMIECEKGQVVEDSLLSIDEITGSIYFTEGFGVVLPCSQETSTGIGDYWDWALMDKASSVAYLTFPIPLIPSGYRLQSAQLSIYCFGWMGNSVVGQYPIFDLQGNATNPPCILEHIDYGDQLDPGDLFPLQVYGQTELFDLQTPANSWTYVDVTEWALNDIGLGRDKAQFRIYLDGYADWDDREDLIGTTTDSNVYNTHAPRLKYTLTNGISSYVPELIEDQLQLHIYPNPTTIGTKIDYYTESLGVNRVTFFNIRGQIVKTIIHEATKSGEQNICWDGKDTHGGLVESGVYLVRVEDGAKTEVCRIVVLH